MRWLRFITAILFLLLLANMYGVFRFVETMNEDFDRVEKAEIAKYGHAYTMGDCSGVSLILPVLMAAYLGGFAFWSLILLITSRAPFRAAYAIQATLIFCLGIAPFLYWLGKLWMMGKLRLI